MDSLEPFCFDNIPPLHQKLVPTSKQVAEQFKEEGIRVRTGAFSAEEDQQIRLNMQNFMAEYPGKTSEWLLGYGVKPKNYDRSNFINDTQFWARLAHGLPDRLLDAVRRRARKVCHKNGLQHGERRRKFSAEDAKRLASFHAAIGNDYVRISQLCNRTPSSIERKVAYMRRRDDAARSADDADVAIAEKLIYGELDADQSVWDSGIPGPSVKKRMRCIQKAIDTLDWQKRMKDHLTDVINPFLRRLSAEVHVSQESEIDWKTLAREFRMPNARSAQHVYEAAMTLYKKRSGGDEERLPLRKKLKRLRRFFKRTEGSIDELCNTLFQDKKKKP